MTSPRAWTVNRPGPLTQRAPGLWTIDDQVPGLPGASRRMSVVRRRDGTLLFYNAIPVDDATLAAVRALGAPAQLVVPNQFHALDAAAFVARLQVTAYAPPVAVAALASLLTCRPIDQLPVDEGLRCFTVEGFKTKEVLLLVDGALLVADLVTNAPHGKGLTGLLMRVVGFTGPAPKLPKPVRRRVERDVAAVRALLESLAKQPGLKRIIPSHGDLIEQDAAQALKLVASTL